MSSTPTHSLDFCGVISESKRIVGAHSRHFLALAVVFFLPLSFSLIIFPTLQTILSQPTTISSFLYFPSEPTAQSLTFPLLYVLFVLILFLSGVATISYSTFHGFYGRPVKFAAAIKSLFYSFLPLLATVLIVQLIVALVAIAFALFMGILLRTSEAILDYAIEYNSSYFIGITVTLGIVLALLLVWFQLNWTLASIIVVAESKWGFESLRRSTYLMKGMRSLSLLLMFFYGFTSGCWLWISSTPLVNSNGIADWKTWAFILQTVGSSAFVTLFMLQNTVANTVLYMYCKALHGELAFEIAEEFSQEYLSLPFDDEKLPHVVTVVQA